MTGLAATVGIVILLEFLAFALLYRFSSWSGKQVAFTVIVFTLVIYIPIGILNWSSLDHFAIHFAFYIMIPYVLGIITTHWEIRKSEEAATQGKPWFHWAPATLVIFFLILAVVDATILTIAEKGVSPELMARLFPESKTAGTGESRFSGTVSHDFQEKEALFNAYLEKRRVQEARGWKVRKGWLDKAVAGQSGIFQVMIDDRHGNPVTEAEIKGQFLRPSNSDLDQLFEMREIKPGTYQVEMNLPVPGLWSLAMTIVRGEDWHEVRAKTMLQAD